MNILDSLHWRYAAKVFDPGKKIPEETWAQLKEALILSPSSYGLQPYQFIDVRNPDLRKRLRAASWKQSQVEDASHYLVFIGLKKVTEDYIQKFIELSSSVREIPADSPALTGYKRVMVSDLVKGPRAQWIPEWAARQAYIAMGNLMTAAAALGVDTCPMEGLDPAAYDDILELNNSPYRTLAGLALGYRSEADKYASIKKVRFPEKDLIKVL